MTPSVLTINGGSSSIRFAIFEAGPTPQRQLGGRIDRIGTRQATLTVDDADGLERRERFATRGRRAAVAALLDWLGAHPAFASVGAVGHRVVHGLTHTEPERITPRLVAELRRLTPYAPDHLPWEIALIEACQRRYPRVPQVACFDTAFHRTLPPVARRLPIPRRYADRGVERYGFHGLSYASLMDALGRLDAAAARGRVILAHLGSGASLAAVRAGKCVDTSMGFTPAAGLMMSTRSGDLDPGLAGYLARTERMSPARFERLVNHECGLLGVSGTSADVRDLLARQAHDARAREAITLFCYQATKWIGAFAAALSGLDTLVFAGGIGEHAPLVRQRICRGLGWIGIDLDPGRNRRNAPLISRDAGRVRVRVIPTDEERMIATDVLRILNRRPRRPRRS
ncbi:MAG TPA: acetate/propionate family kinase [Vicinamibacterales bacterium]|nr:acetate/propionate family kinase [Vicinamibacterales bacterium]